MALVCAVLMVVAGAAYAATGMSPRSAVAVSPGHGQPSVVVRGAVPGPSAAPSASSAPTTVPGHGPDTATGHGPDGTAGPGRGAPRVSGGGPVTGGTVLLRPGDTLWRLSQRCRTTVVVLQRLNRLGGSTLIRAGRRLVVPAGGCSGAGGPVPVRSTVTAVVVPDAGVARVVGYARAQLGKPYVFGAAGPDAFDCSGLVMRAWQSVGVVLPHLAADQARHGVRTSRGALQPGDLIFTNGYGHVELYIGAGQVIYAPHSGAVVKQSSLPAAGLVDAYVHLALPPPATG